MCCGGHGSIIAPAAPWGGGHRVAQAGATALATHAVVHRPAPPAPARGGRGGSRRARTSCADFAQTVRFISMPEQKRREFQVEAGKPLDPIVLGEVLGAAIDEDTMSRIEDAGKIEIRDYEAVKLYVEQRHTKLTSRAAGKAIPKDFDKMVYGVEEAQPAAAASVPAAAEAVEDVPYIRPRPVRHQRRHQPSLRPVGATGPVYDPWATSARWPRPMGVPAMWPRGAGGAMAS